MSLLRKNISFQRGQDPKKVMDIGMTPPRLMMNTIKKLQKAGIKLGSSSSNDDHFVIQGGKHVSFNLVYTDKNKLWTFVSNHSKEIAYSQEGIMKIIYNYSEDFYSKEINRITEKIIDYKSRLDKVQKSIESLNK